MVKGGDGAGAKGKTPVHSGGAVARLVPVTDDMGGLSWRAPCDFGFLRNAGVVELGLDELTESVASLPLFAQVKGGRGRLVTRFAESGSDGLVTPQGQLAAGYVPACVRAFPFCMMTSSDGAHHLCIDGNYLVDGPKSDDTIRFQDELGHATPQMRARISVLKAWLSGRVAAQDAVRELVDRRVLQSCGDDGMQGFMTLDRAAFAQALDKPDDAMSSAALTVGFALLYSAPNRAKLAASVSIGSPVAKETGPSKGMDFLSSFAGAAGLAVVAEQAE